MQVWNIVRGEGKTIRSLTYAASALPTAHGAGEDTFDAVYSAMLKVILVYTLSKQPKSCTRTYILSDTAER